MPLFTLFDLQNENGVIDIKKNSLAGQTLLSYDEEKESNLKKVPINFFARNVLHFDRDCRVDNKLVTKQDINTLAKRLREPIRKATLSEDETNSDEESIVDHQSDAVNVLIAHSVLFVMITFLQRIASSFNISQFFICCVFMNTPSTIASLILIQNHFSELRSDLV